MSYLEALHILKHALELSSAEFSKLKDVLYEIEKYILDKKIVAEIQRNNFGEALLIIDDQLLKNTKFKKYYFLSDLEEFHIEEEDGITIQQIKDLLRIERLQFCEVKDSTGKVAPYCEHWEIERRICVSIDRDLIYRIKEDRNKLLVLFKKVKEAKLGYYYRFTIKEYFKPRKNDLNKPNKHRHGPKAYGYDTWDEMAFIEAFNGDSDAWGHYNQ